MRRWIVLALVLFILCVGSITLLVLHFDDASQGTVEFEAAKALLQLGVVGVAGAIVSVLVFEYQRKRQLIDKAADVDRLADEKRIDLDRKSREYRETLLLSVLSRALDAYSRAKKARRKMRGRAIATRGQEVIVFADQYDICLDVLNDAQIDLETLTRDVETSDKAFSNRDALVKNLQSMEDYLRNLIGEYEDWRSSFSGDPPSLPLRKLEHLENFLKKSDLSEFKAQMVQPRREVQRLIRGDLQHPSLPESIAEPNLGAEPDRPEPAVRSE